jgi:hypothetical protein
MEAAHPRKQLFSFPSVKDKPTCCVMNHFLDTTSLCKGVSGEVEINIILPWILPDRKRQNKYLELYFAQNTVMHMPIARQQFSKHIPAAYVLNNRRKSTAR